VLVDQRSSVSIRFESYLHRRLDLITALSTLFSSCPANSRCPSSQRLSLSLQPSLAQSINQLFLCGWVFVYLYEGFHRKFGIEPKELCGCLASIFLTACLAIRSGKRQQATCVVRLNSEPFFQNSYRLVILVRRPVTDTQDRVVVRRGHGIQAHRFIENGNGFLGPSRIVQKETQKRQGVCLQRKWESEMGIFRGELVTLR